MKIAIVGNAQSILAARQGEFIDSHDVVIRFNEFMIKGYEKYCGTKTDIICVCRNITLRRMYSNPIYRDYIQDVDTVWYARTKRKIFTRGCREDEIRRISNITNFRYMSPRFFKAVQTKRNRQTKRWLSTGVMGVYIAIEYFKEQEINVMGFDGFRTHHYYQGNPEIPAVSRQHMKRHKPGKHHCNKTERRILNRLAQKGRINLLP